MIKSGFIAAIALMLFPSAAAAQQRCTVVYDNGSAEVVCGEPETLAAKDGTALAEPEVLFTLDGEDAYYSWQWGLENDGSFNIEAFPEDMSYYIDPFSNPSQITYPGRNTTDTDSTGIIHITINSSDVDVSIGRVKRGIDINIEEAWEALTEKNEVVVAVIDSGIYGEHIDLADNMWVNPGEIAGNGTDDDNNGYIDDINGWNFASDTNKIYEGKKDNHGTHCAGTIAAVRGNGRGIAGIAGDGNVKIMSLKVLNDSGEYISSAALVNAIKYAEDNGASICNLSIGSSDYSEALYNAINDSDMLFVTSAGNGANWTANGTNDDESPVYPAAFDCQNIISVANMQYDGHLCRTSNYGAETVDIAAPGTYTLSTTSYDTYSFMTGTSMAAPMVTGTAALLYSQNADMTAARAKEIILASAKETAALTDYVAVGGMLDAGAALKYTEESETGGFSDIKYSWAKEYIEQVSNAGILIGTSENEFSPNKAMTRAMTAQMLYRLCKEPDTEVYGGFDDVYDGQWYAAAVSWAYNVGLMKGYDDKTFGTDDRLRREQLCEIMYRYEQIYGNGTEATGSISGFKDADRVSDWAAESVAWAANNGYLHYTGNRLRPKSSATRADAAAMAAMLGTSEN